MGMKYRDPQTGQFKDLKVKTSDTLPIGTQVAYGGTTVPTGWLICDGSAVSRTVYADLFSVIGTSYGAGDGSTTFNLPNKNIQPTEVDNWIIKAYQSIAIVGRVVNEKSSSTKDTYSSDYINKLLYYKNNDTYETTRNYYLGSMLSNSATRVYATIFTNKSLKNIKTITVNNYNISARTVDGNYILNNVTPNTFDGVCNAEVVGDNAISIYWTANSAYSTTNNTPIGLSLNSLKLTFNESAGDNT